MDDPPDTAVGDFDGAFAQASVKVDQTYTTPDQSHMAMEPFATIAAWQGDKLTVWTSNQMIDWARRDLSEIFGMPREQPARDRPASSAAVSAPSCGSAATS